MAFGTDDEKALENGFNNNFERATHLSCEIHLKKNLEKKLIELGITGHVKDNVIFDVFGRQNGDVFESGLADAANKEEFENLLKCLKQRWSDAHSNGSYFYDWFIEQKARQFLESVISPVRQRAGLGCPPERFTTNRSERTNGVIQEFVKRECNGKKVDEYVFATTLQKLINIQEKEVELAVIGQGEYKLRDRFKHISVPTSRWSKMTEKQMATALNKIHTISLDDGLDSNVSTVSRALRDDDHPLMEKFARAGVDWIPRDVLVHVIAKASSLENKVHVLPDGIHQTVIVPSSNPKKPHVVIVHANGKCECQDCLGYNSAFVCAHTIATSLKLDRLDAFLKWLVTMKRKTGGINYSRAITYGMPTGRGKKPNQAPRKSSKVRHPSQNSITVLPRITTQIPPNPLSQQASSHEPTLASCSSGLPPPIQLPNVFHHQCAPRPTIPQPQIAPLSSANLSELPMIQQHPVNYPTPVNTISQQNYPCPQPDMFLIYLLGMCPKQTSICFGCRNSLKPGGVIGTPPADLVIVSKMVRTWTHEGQQQSQHANVYFHCVPTCVRQKQPYFQPCHTFIASQIVALLRDEHWQYLNQTFGNLAIR